MSSPSHARRKILIGLDGSRFEIESLIDHTIRVLVRNRDDIVFISRIQTSRDVEYDDQLLRCAAKKLKSAGVRWVEILIHTSAGGSFSHPDIATKLLEYAELIAPSVLVLGKNDVRYRRTALGRDPADVALRRRDCSVPLMIVNFAPELDIHDDTCLNGGDKTVAS
jgi:hypothetical protein